MSAGTQSPLGFLLVSALASGVVFHQFAKNVDIDRYPLSILGSVFLSHFLMSFSIQLTSDVYGTFWAAQRLSCLVISCAIVSLWTNILIYRAFFHPLNSFPGPFGAKLSKFWSIHKVIQSKVKWYKVVDELHKKYGDYVRTGMPFLLGIDEASTN
jgi:hypothetical protein